MEQDILITPELNGFSSSNFKDAHTIVPNGIAAARAVSAQLQLLAIQPDGYDQYLADKYRTETTPPVISFIRIENNSPLADEFIQSQTPPAVG